MFSDDAQLHPIFIDSESARDRSNKLFFKFYGSGVGGLDLNVNNFVVLNTRRIIHKQVRVERIGQLKHQRNSM
jgi:hypothetical protein